jgi:glucans biosynthesis protein C
VQESASFGRNHRNAFEAVSLKPNQERLFFLDWLRISAFAVLVLYHVGMYYVSWDFHVKSPFAGTSLEPWMRLTAPWRMDLIFMVSGAATALMLRSDTSFDLLRRRTRFLLLPLLLGMVLIVPPQSYFEVVQKFGFKEDYFSFLGLYFARYNGFCQNNKCLILPTWNHLWFLPYLWLYTLLLWSLLKIKPSTLTLAGRMADQLLGSFGLMLIPVIVIWLIRLTLYARFPSTHAVLGDWFNHAMYLSMFLTGAVFANRPSLWPRLKTWRWPALVLALSCWAFSLSFSFLLSLGEPLSSGNFLGLKLDFLANRNSFHLVIAAMQWGAIIAAFGFAQQLLNFDHPMRQVLGEAVFPVYVLHQTITIVFTQVLRPLRWPPILEGPILVALTFLLSYLGYLAVRRITLLRPWFGLRPLPNRTHAHP